MPDGVYLTRFCATVGCQIFSSDAFTPVLPSVEHCSNKCSRGSKRGANTSLRKRQNDANYGPCAPVESKTTPLGGSKVAVQKRRIERDSREPSQRVFSHVNAGIA